MRPDELLAESLTPDGQRLSLVREGGRLVVRVGNVPLMGSTLHGSEEAMAEIACAPLRGRPGVRVLVGGLGMGFTARAALDALGPDAEVVVAELLPALVEWNRGILGPLANHPLADPRLRLDERDVAVILRESRGAFDAVLLDVDNGPDALTTEGNAWLYGPGGLAAARTALRPGGVLVVWSAYASRPFVRAMRQAGFAADAVPVRARGKIKKGARHVLFVGRRPGR